MHYGPQGRKLFNEELKDSNAKYFRDVLFYSICMKLVSYVAETPLARWQPGGCE